MLKWSILVTHFAFTKIKNLVYEFRSCWAGKRSAINRKRYIKVIFKVNVKDIEEIKRISVPLQYVSKSGKLIPCMITFAKNKNVRFLFYNASNSTVFEFNLSNCSSVGSQVYEAAFLPGGNSFINRGR